MRWLVWAQTAWRRVGSRRPPEWGYRGSSMAKVRFLVLLGSLTASLIALFGAGSVAQNANSEQFLRSIYATYQKSDRALDIGSEQKAARYFVPSLAKLIGEDIATAAAR